MTSYKPATHDRTEGPLALLPVDVSWKLAAYLPITGQVPDSVHVSLQKRWFERWGAEIVATQAAMLDFGVLRPPTTITEACIVADAMLTCDWGFDYANTREASVVELALLVLNGEV